MTVDKCPVHALRLTSLELSFKVGLRSRVLGKQHEARRVTIDTVDDERVPFTVRPHVLDEVVINGIRSALPLERNGEQSSRLVHDQQLIVFVQDPEIGDRCRSKPSPRAPGPVPPETDDVADHQAGAGILQAGFPVVEIHLTPLKRDRHAPP
jgi:hypothetical protein